MDWQGKPGQKLIHKAIVSTFKRHAPNRVGMTSLITCVMNELQPGHQEYMDCYQAARNYILINTGKGRPFSFREGVCGGYALKPATVKKKGLRQLLSSKPRK